MAEKESPGASRGIIYASEAVPEIWTGSLAGLPYPGEHQPLTCRLHKVEGIARIVLEQEPIRLEFLEEMLVA